MNDTEASKKLTRIVWLLSANLVMLTIGAAALMVGLLPKVERAVEATERVEERFQSFADEVQPVLSSGAGKAIETIQKMDAERLSETATDKTDILIEAASERAKRYLERDRKTE
ncbi:hypothetical protein CA13_58840 [Planctomycetes bacterium CA13]|uniref:Uncharacterized protein n=1 Tax=Novipirellula herctigrandis TaxID=2527986 RepID=A0A5C5ZB81_9BACT|nr:hypothetical protein CA13_58840 [Planctomycetes bacterium CA13]